MVPGKRVHWLLVMLIAIYLSTTFSEARFLYENDECILHDGSTGLCTRSYNCAWYNETVINKRQFNQRVGCTFDGEIEIICCKVEGSPIETRVRLACDKVPENVLVFHIVEGEEAAPGEFPFMAALGYVNDDKAIGYKYRCGASLIDEQFLLTAAHCFRSDPPVVAKLGTINLKSNEGELFRIKDYYLHPNYKKGITYNDIAVIKLDRRVSGVDIMPICLYSRPEDFPETTILSAEGFGLHNVDTLEHSDILLKVNVATVPISKCDEMIRILPSIPKRIGKGIMPTQLCAKGQKNEVTFLAGDACEGDSGGPLNIFEDGRYKLVGITSVGFGCGGETPGIYTRVSQYIDWIENIVWSRRDG